MGPVSVICTLHSVYVKGVVEKDSREDCACRISVYKVFSRGRHYLISQQKDDVGIAYSMYKYSYR